MTRKSKGKRNGSSRTSFAPLAIDSPEIKPTMSLRTAPPPQNAFSQSTNQHAMTIEQIDDDEKSDQETAPLAFLSQSAKLDNTESKVEDHESETAYFLPATSSNTASYARANTSFASPLTSLLLSSAETSETNLNDNSYSLVPSNSSSSANISQMISTRLSSLPLTTVVHTLVHDHIVRAKQQDAVNHVHSQMHSMNFLFNYANYHTANQLIQQYNGINGQLQSGREMLQSLSNTVCEQDERLDELDGIVTTIDTTLKQQSVEFDRIANDVEAQKISLTTALQTYEEKLTEQEGRMKAQEIALERLLSIRFRLDFGVDAVIMLMSYYLSRHPLVMYALRILFSTLLPSSKSVTNLRSEIHYLRKRRLHLATAISQLLIFMILVRWARKWAVDHGLHNLVGNYGKYGEYFLHSVGYTAGSLINAARHPKDVIASAKLSNEPHSPTKSLQIKDKITSPMSLPAKSMRSSIENRAEVFAEQVGGKIGDAVNSIGQSVMSFFSWGIDPNPFHQQLSPDKSTSEPSKFGGT